MPKPPRVRAASGKRGCAILGRRHVPAIPKSRKETRAAQGAGLSHRAHPSRTTRPTQAPLLERSRSIAQRKRHLFRDRERPDTAHESRFGGPMLDQADHYIGPCRCVLDRGVIAVRALKNCTIATKQVRLFPCANACARAMPASNPTASATTSSFSIGKCIARRAITLCAEPEPRQPPCSAHRLDPHLNSGRLAYLTWSPALPYGEGLARCAIPWNLISLGGCSRTRTCGPLIKSLRFAISSRFLLCHSD